MIDRWTNRPFLMTLKTSSRSRSWDCQHLQIAQCHDVWDFFCLFGICCFISSKDFEFRVNLFIVWILAEIVVSEESNAQPCARHNPPALFSCIAGNLELNGNNLKPSHVHIIPCAVMTLVASSLHRTTNHAQTWCRAKNGSTSMCLIEMRRRQYSKHV